MTLPGKCLQLHLLGHYGKKPSLAFLSQILWPMISPLRQLSPIKIAQSTIGANWSAFLNHIVFLGTCNITKTEDHQKGDFFNFNFEQPEAAWAFQALVSSSKYKDIAIAISSGQCLAVSDGSSEDSFGRTGSLDSHSFSSPIRQHCHCPWFCKRTRVIPKQINAILLHCKNGQSCL